MRPRHREPTLPPAPPHLHDHQIRIRHPRRQIQIRRQRHRLPTRPHRQDRKSVVQGKRVAHRDRRRIPRKTSHPIKTERQHRPRPPPATPAPDLTRPPAPPTSLPGLVSKPRTGCTVAYDAPAVYKPAKSATRCVHAIVNQPSPPPPPTFTITRFGSVTPAVRFRFDANGIASPHGHTVKIGRASCRESVSLTATAAASPGKPATPSRQSGNIAPAPRQRPQHPTSPARPRPRPHCPAWYPNPAPAAPSRTTPPPYISRPSPPPDASTPS